jgi:two-component system NtrC family response regulator
MVEGASVLIVDDEPNMGAILKKVLKGSGFSAAAVTSAEEALKYADSNPVDAVLSDIRMPGMDGISLLKEIKNRDPDIAVVLMTAYGTPGQEALAKELGAYHYIRKPFDNEEVIQTLRLALERRQLIQQTRHQSRQLEDRNRLDNIIGKSPRMLQVFDLILKVAPTDANVLILGETGTGKDLVANAIHYHSPRKDKEIYPINCSAIPEGLIGSELFGHVKGAFTDARTQKKGIFEAADGGTVFLDEIGEMPLDLQTVTLRVIETGEFRPVGGIKSVKADVRIIAATNVDLQQRVKEGRFRQDLYHRLNVMTIRLPALRERRNDIPLLVNHFIEKHNKKTGRFVSGVGPEAMRVLMEYSWPGNVRELENVIERALILRFDGDIEINDLPEEINPDYDAHEITWETGEVVPYKVAKDAFERKYFQQLLAANAYNVTRSAMAAGLSRRYLQEKIKQMKILRGRKGEEENLEE